MYRIHYTVRRHGVFLGKTSERLVIRKDSETLRELPLRRLRSILIDARGVSLSAALVQSCAKFGVEISFLDFRKRAVSRLSAPHQNETVATMRAQFAAAKNGKGFSIARRMVREKLKARRRLVNYHKRRATNDEAIAHYLSHVARSIQHLDELKGGRIENVRSRLMGIEGASAKAYWAAIRETISDEVKFERREHRGAEGLVNRMLNYGYAILEARVWAAVEQAGLHPYGGMLHAWRPGKPSLVLDFMEPWRIIVDDAVFSSLRRYRKKLGSQFDGRAKKIVIREVVHRLDSPRKYGKKRLPTRECMVEAARNAGVYFRGEAPFRPFRWDVRGPKRPDTGGDSTADDSTEPDQP